MNENIYVMPKLMVDKKGIYEHMTNLFSTYKYLMNSTIILDFSNTNYIKPTLMAPLGLILTKLKSQKNMVFLRNTKTSIKQLLIKYGFIQNINVCNTNIPQNFIKYETFNGDNEERFSKYLDDQFKYINNTEIVASLKTHIMEIFINVKMHARTKGGSRYKNKEIFTSGFYDREKEKVIFSIANNGQTFSENIISNLNYDFQLENEYILWALKETNTSTKNRTGGIGLTMLHDLVVSSNGFLYILSGQGYYQYESNSRASLSESYDLSSGFPGTVISIELPIYSIPIIYENLNLEYVTLSNLII